MDDDDIMHDTTMNALPPRHHTGIELTNHKMEHLLLHPGDSFPDVTLWRLIDGKGPHPINTSQLGKDDDIIVIVGVPGPFTPGRYRYLERAVFSRS